MGTGKTLGFLGVAHPVGGLLRCPIASWLLGGWLLISLMFPFFRLLVPGLDKTGAPQFGAFHLVALGLGLIGAWGLHKARGAKSGSKRILLCTLNRRCASCLQDLNGVRSPYPNYVTCPECGHSWNIRAVSAIESE